MGIGFHHEGWIIAALELLLVDLRHASGKNLASSWGPFVSSEVERHTFGSRGSWFVRNARLALAIRPAKSIWTPMTYQVHIIGGGQIGRAHVSTPVTNAHLVCRLLLEQKTQRTNK